ncbi:MAG: hypothetical protein EXR39_19190 [Betaproteobacteria bacterium]|nr:hypothetical protein [Betaproteobacteria bacterium]
MNAADLPKLKTRRLAYAFGVEIMDMDLRERLDDTTIASIRALWNEYGIVLMRNQDITPRQLIDYSRRFGHGPPAAGLDLSRADPARSRWRHVVREHRGGLRRAVRCDEKDDRAVVGSA